MRPHPHEKVHWNWPHHSRVGEFLLLTVHQGAGMLSANLRNSDAKIQRNSISGLDLTLFNYRIIAIC